MVTPGSRRGPVTSRAELVAWACNRQSCLQCWQAEGKIVLSPASSRIYWMTMERRQSISNVEINATAVTPEQFIAAFESTTITSVGCIGSGRVGVCTMATMAKRCVLFDVATIKQRFWHGCIISIPNVKFTVFDDDPYVVCSCQTGPLPFYEPDLVTKDFRCVLLGSAI
jgi:hypothetical protein